MTHRNQNHHTKADLKRLVGKCAHRVGSGKGQHRNHNEVRQGNSSDYFIQPIFSVLFITIVVVSDIKRKGTYVVNKPKRQYSKERVAQRNKQITAQK